MSEIKRKVNIWPFHSAWIFQKVIFRSFKPPATNKKFGVESANNMITCLNWITFQTVQTNSILKSLKKFDINKTAGIGNIAGRFLEDGANVLGIPMAQICYLSIKLSRFPKDSKVAKRKPLYKKVAKTDPKNLS